MARQTWTPEEDQRIIDAVNNTDSVNEALEKLATEFPHRNLGSYRNRYYKLYKSDTFTEYISEISIAYTSMSAELVTLRARIKELERIEQDHITLVRALDNARRMTNPVRNVVYNNGEVEIK